MVVVGVRGVGILLHYIGTQKKRRRQSIFFGQFIGFAKKKIYMSERENKTKNKQTLKKPVLQKKNHDNRYNLRTWVYRRRRYPVYLNLYHIYFYVTYTVHFNIQY